MKQCEAVSWKEVGNASGLETFAEVDIALRTWIGGLNEKYENKVYRNKLMEACKANGWIEPGEGMLPEIIINNVLAAMQKEGNVWFTHEESLLFTTHWDSHFSLLCGSKSMMDRIVKEANWEGFDCEEKTEIYWSVRNSYMEKLSQGEKFIHREQCGPRNVWP